MALCRQIGDIVAQELGFSNDAELLRYLKRRRRARVEYHRCLRRSRLLMSASEKLAADAAERAARDRYDMILYGEA
jgi:hypothetical protein